MPSYKAQPGSTTYNFNIYDDYMPMNNIRKVQEQSWKDLSEYVETLQIKNKDLIISMDVNSEIHQPSIWVTKFAQQFDLYDANDTTCHPMSMINTHKRGSQLIDTILISARIKASIIQSHILSFDEIIESDHRGLIRSFYIQYSP